MEGIAEKGAREGENVRKKKKYILPKMGKLEKAAQKGGQ
jgi:hypothetical protein